MLGCVDEGQAWGKNGFVWMNRFFTSRSGRQKKIVYFSIYFQKYGFD